MTKRGQKVELSQSLYLPAPKCSNDSRGLETVAPCHPEPSPELFEYSKCGLREAIFQFNPIIQ